MCLSTLTDGLTSFESLIHQLLDEAETRILYSHNRPLESAAAFEDVLSATAHTSETLQRVMLRIRRRVNRLTPVNRLPPELLCHILSIVASQAGTRTSVLLSHVCSYWRDLTLDDPRLWTSITIINPRTLPALPVLLARAKTQPVDLRLYLVDIKGNEEQAQAALGSLVSHMSHMGKLLVSFNAELRKNLFRRLCEVSAPALTSLVLSCTAYSSRYPLPGNLFNGVAPKLVELELSHISPVNLVKAFASVRTLEMLRCSITVDTLHRISVACPLVEDITLHGWEGYASRMGLQGELIQFDCLQQIVFIDLVPDNVESILRNLDCSDLECIKIKSGQTSRNVSHLGLLQQVLGTLGPVTEALVEGWPIRQSARDSEPTRRYWRVIAFDREDAAREVAFEDSLAPLPRGALNPDGRLLRAARKLTVDARCWTPFLETLADDEAPALGVLKIHVPEDAGDAALWHLNALLKPVLDAKKPLRCPGLRKLTLRARKRVDVSAESVLQLLDQAVQFNAAKLKELRLKNINVKQGMGLEMLRARVEDFSMDSRT
ncbi:hypothetical protein AURDEDRAFT_112502 [Auricularia subglabra TFB-10046 SS5]|nr:hypothetical protein AURDEDRAFT_112502 [Auricularia subglabra TFB-10046 SS5]